MTNHATIERGTLGLRNSKKNHIYKYIYKYKYSYTNHRIVLYCIVHIPCIHIQKPPLKHFWGYSNGVYVMLCKCFNKINQKIFIFANIV
jgi:hypothetical protein